jgi:hypothetical protein
LVSVVISPFPNGLSAGRAMHVRNSSFNRFSIAPATVVQTTPAGPLSADNIVTVPEGDKRRQAKAAPLSAACEECARCGGSPGQCSPAALEVFK